MGRRFLTKRGKETKEAVAWEVKSQWNKQPIKDPIAVQVKFYFKDKRGLDIDGGLKSLFDCMTGIVWVDDRQIVEAHVFKFIDKDNPRTEVQLLWKTDVLNK